MFIEGEKKNEKKTEEILYNVQMIKEEYKKKYYCKTNTCSQSIVVNVPS